MIHLIKWIPVLLILSLTGAVFALTFNNGSVVIVPMGGGKAVIIGGPTQSPNPGNTPTPTPYVLAWSGGTQAGGQAFNVSTYFPISGYLAADAANPETYANKVSGVYTLENFCCTCSPTQQSGNSLIVNLRDNLSDTGLTKSIVGSACDLVDTFITARGDLLEIRIMPSPGPTPTATPAPYACTCSIGP